MTEPTPHAEGAALNHLDVEDMSLERLIPYARNPRKNDGAVDKVAASIKEFGWRSPIVVDEEMVILAGHTRYKAAKKLGLDIAPVHIAKGLSEAQKKAYRIADNRVAEEAEWDLDMLKLEFEDLDPSEYGMTGFDDDFLKDLLAETSEAEVDEENLPELPEDPITKPGDVWVMGSHRLMCGDSTNLSHVEQLCEGRHVDMLLTDPPYNVNYEGGTGLKIQNDSMEDTEFRQFLRDAFVAADSVMKAGAVFYIWHADSEGYNFRGACHDTDWNVRQTLIWKKSSLVMGRQDYQWLHEPCLYGWKEGAGHLWASDRKQTTILEFEKPKKNDVHPTMKPIALFEYQMLNNTKGGDLVLDLFGGSGTTLLAAEKNGRHARLMELDPKYCDVIVKRWEDYTGKKAVLEEHREAA